MPLRDHFRPPVDLMASWDALHGMWPGEIVQHLRSRLPEDFIAAPTVRRESDYSVQVYDVSRGRQLVATIEIVSPANKDRPDARNAFVGKCAALLRKGVAVTIVDLVTTRQANLYADLLQFLGVTDPSLTDPPPHVYAGVGRWTRSDRSAVLRTWAFPLAVEQPLPVLPLWLTPTHAIPLDLEATYEQACHDLWIT